MTAEIAPLTWGWYCADCAVGGDSGTEDEAAVDADTHDRENHR